MRRIILILSGTLLLLTGVAAQTAVDWATQVRGKNIGAFTGPVSGSAGTFTGPVSGTSGTFAGPVAGTSGTFTGPVSGTTGTFTGAVNSAGASVLQNLTVPNGGYFVFPPVSYNPFGSPSTCFDVYGNKVQQPTPATGAPAFGINDLVMWNSLSPSMPFAANTGVGLVQKLVVTSPATTNTGPCGVSLPVNTDYGINTNGYFFGRGGIDTDNPRYNSIQSLQGGVVANSYTAGTLYPAGTTVCTAMTGSMCTATSVLGQVTYLGGHVDSGHSSGPPQGNSILTSTNPFSDGEGNVAGQMYYDDALHCEAVYSGSSWGCIAASGGTTPGLPNASVQFNSSGVFAGNSNFAWNNTTGVLQVCLALGGICGAASGVDAQAFSSSATGTAVAYTDAGANFSIQGNGNANFKVVNVGSGAPLSIDVSGNLVTTGAITVGSCTGCGGGGGGTPGAPSGSVQFNNTGAFAGNTNFSWNNATGVLQVCTALGGICGANSGVNAQAFSSSATGAAVAYTDTGANFNILGNGGAAFKTLNVGSGAPFSVDVSGNITTFGTLSVASCSGCGGGGGGSPASPSGSVQFNNTGVFGGNTNFSWNNGTGVLQVCTALGGICAATSGVNAQAFSSSATGTAIAFTDVSGNFNIEGNGSGNFQALNATSGNFTGVVFSVGLSSVRLDGFTAAFIQDNSGSAAAATLQNNGSGPGLAATTAGASTVATFVSATGSCNIEPITTALVCSSDARLKRDDQTISSAVHSLMQLRPITFAWKKDESAGRHAGFFAQEVQSVFPELVEEGSDGYFKLNQTGMIPYLVRAIQEQQIEIDALKSAASLTRSSLRVSAK